MSDADNSELVKLMLRRLDANDISRLVELMSPDVEFTDPTGTSRGRAAMAERLTAQAEAFSQNHTEIKTLANCSDTVTLELVVTTTHTGTLRAPQGDVPATGKTISIPYCNVVRIEAGLVDSVHLYFDQLEFMAQLGLLPQPVQA